MNMIYRMHRHFNGIHSLVEGILEEIIKLYPSAVLGMYKGHYIKLGDEYVLQKYPLPVITIEGLGDVGVNLDKVWFEFFVSKKQALELDFDLLISKYEIECYGGKDCMEDFYQAGDKGEGIKDKIKQSTEAQVGIAIYIREEQDREKLIKAFNEVVKVVRG